MENLQNSTQANDISTKESKPHSPQPRRGLWILIGLLVLFGVFRIGYSAGSAGLTFSPSEFKIINQTGSAGAVDYGLLWEAISTVKSKYIEKDTIDDRKILYGAIRGAVSSVGDEYTEFLDPETLAEFKSELQGTFSGIGAEVGKRNGNIVIIAPLEGAPAEAAGLLPQDIILSVNGENVTDKTIDQAVRLIRGESGTQVTLSIFREGRDAPFDVTITRAQIEVKSVKIEFREVNGQAVAILSLSRFGDDTQLLFDQAIGQMNQRGVSKLILDLRNNPGGYLNTAVDIASEWLPNGSLVVTEAQSNGGKLEYLADSSARLKNAQTLVLINGGSASAAEILAGALHDHGRAKLIGEKSFGKGSVQELIPIGQDSAVKVTIAKWITPGGVNLNHDGLQPDIEVELNEEDYQQDRDPQLDRALQEIVQ